VHVTSFPAGLSALVLRREIEVRYGSCQQHGYAQPEILPDSMP